MSSATVHVLHYSSVERVRILTYDVVFLHSDLYLCLFYILQYQLTGERENGEGKREGGRDGEGRGRRRRRGRRGREGGGREGKENDE